MKKKFSFSICLSLFFLTSFVFPLTSLSQDTTFRYYPQFTKYTLISNPDGLHFIDTAIDFFYHYNPAERPLGYMHLGYVNSPERPMFFSSQTNPDIDIGFHQFDLYWRNIEDIKFYDTREPYTSLAYQQGSRNEILASVIHSQNISPHLGFGVDYNRMRTDGWYQRQTTKLSNFDAFFRVNAADNRYEGMAVFVLNTLRAQINGGLLNDKIFSDSTLFDKSLAQVYLDSAQSNWKNDEVAVVNALNFGKLVVREKKDSVVKKKVNTEFRLQHRFEWEKRKFLYSDGAHDGPFYTGDTLDVIPTGDSVILNRVTNELRLSKLQHDTAARSFKFSADAFLRYSDFKIQNKSLDKRFQSAILGADFSTLFFSKLKLNSFGQLNLIDRNRGDFILDASLDYVIGKGRMGGVEASIASNHPTVIEQQYRSAFFNWDSSFSNLTTTSASAFYLDQRWKIKIVARVFSQSNFIYWIYNGIPAQLDGALNGFNISLAKNIRVWRIHLDNEFMYQEFNNDSVVAFPKFILRSSLYYQDDVFNRALQTKVGIEIRYNDDYFSPAYEPATGQFPLQKISSQQYYPIVDFFLVVKVKAVRGFLEVQNLSQGILGNGNFSAYRYPMADRSFKVGLQWMFWN